MIPVILIQIFCLLTLFIIVLFLLTVTIQMERIFKTEAGIQIQFGSFLKPLIAALNGMFQMIPETIQTKVLRPYRSRQLPEPYLPLRAEKQYSFIQELILKQLLLIQTIFQLSERIQRQLLSRLMAILIHHHYLEFLQILK